MPAANPQSPDSIDVQEVLARINGASRARSFQLGQLEHRLPILSKITISLTAQQRRALLILAAMAIGLALFVFVSGQAKPHADLIVAVPQESSSAIAETTLVVDVQGEVLNPGVYQLSPGSRVGDAIKAAGGVKEGSDSSSVNLARFLEDGEQIYVSNPDLSEQPSSSQGQGKNVGQGRLNINRATENELDGLPGVGPVLAKRIISYRTEHGNFGTIDELQKVVGIGPAKFSELRTFITV